LPGFANTRKTSAAGAWGPLVIGALTLFFTLVRAAGWNRLDHPLLLFTKSRQEVKRVSCAHELLGYA